MRFKYSSETRRQTSLSSMSSGSSSLPRRKERMSLAERSAQGSAVAAPHTAPMIACRASKSSALPHAVCLECVRVCVCAQMQLLLRQRVCVCARRCALQIHMQVYAGMLLHMSKHVLTCCKSIPACCVCIEARGSRRDTNYRHSVYVCMHACMHVCIYVCMYMYIPACCVCIEARAYR